MVGGINVIIFTAILLLAQREKKQKKRNGQLEPASGLPDSSVLAIGDGNEKKSSLGDEEDVSPVLFH